MSVQKLIKIHHEFCVDTESISKEGKFTAQKMRLSGRLLSDNFFVGILREKKAEALKRTSAI